MERTLTTLPSTNDTQQTAVVEVVCDDGSVHVELREQAFVEGVGWVTQKRIALDESAVKNLQCALNLFIGDTRVQDTNSKVVCLTAERNRRQAG